MLFSLENYINSILKSIFLNLFFRNSSIEKKAVSAFVLSRLNYYSSLFVGLLGCMLRVQNNVHCIVFHKRKGGHSTIYISPPRTASLAKSGLPNNNVATLHCCCIHDMAPGYLMLSPYELFMQTFSRQTRHIWSLLLLPSGPRVWNAFLLSFYSASTLKAFKDHPH